MLNALKSFINNLRADHYYREGDRLVTAGNITTPADTLQHNASHSTADQQRFARYFASGADLPTPSLNALDTRSPSYLDIISYLIDTGKTPADRMDIQEAYVAIHDRIPGPHELAFVTEQVRSFGLLLES